MIKIKSPYKNKWLFEYYDKEANDALMIGGAAYTYPMHYLKKYENKTIAYTVNRAKIKNFYITQ